MENYGGRTAEEWAEIEAVEHDEEYREAFPFGLQKYSFTVEHALWYEDYAFKKGRRRDRGHRTRKVLQLVDLNSIEGQKILDIGCGIGQYSKLFAKKGAIVTGVELSPVGVEIAKKIAAANNVADQCTFITGEFTKQNFPDEKFDIVLLHEVYHHAIKYPGLKDQIKQITKTGGKIILADTVRGSRIIHMGRRLVKYFRFMLQPEARQHEQDLGDVLFPIEQYETFAKGFSQYELFMMSYLYMIKQTALQYHVDKFYVRWFLRAVKYADDLLLTLLPFLKRGCGEAILYIRK